MFLQVWGADLVEMIFRMSRQGNLLDFSTEEIAVLRAVCLTFTGIYHDNYNAKGKHFI
ncbi:hypothetical protein DPMN_010148 [Dreissena polymorpha]|uniref:Uncharacterized protein n=1 Tax=Dreissena polymorpha TaxID=45954 RepID=A0A9D4MY98_DREPO|nr:hypothetical protein DPMN_010148 [Dreissena polymorpha]